MRPPGRARWLILPLFMALGVAMTLWEPTRAILIGPLWLAGSVLVSAFYLVAVVRAKLLDRLRRRGQPARAVARSVKETKLVVQEMPRLELELDVQAPGGGYTTNKRIVVPLNTVERLKAGEEFPVKVDPDDRDRLAFDWGELSDQPSSWIARACGGPATIDELALAQEKKHIVR
jgi:hypothetical protein